MSVESVSGSTTPGSLSSSITLSASDSTTLKSTFVQDNVYHNPRVQASNIIELIASRSTSSSTVYIYDVAEQAGFGTLTKSWSKSGSTASVVDLQTRAGAGLSLVGRLSEGTSLDTVKGAVLTAYTTPNGLSVMAPSLSYLPVATPNSRLVIQVPTVISVGETFALSSSLAPLVSTLPILPEDIVVLLSATPQESVDFAALSYKLTGSHVIHLFDHHSSSREVGHSIAPLSYKGEGGNTVAEVIHQAGYTFFDYAGDKSAHTVVVLLNGPLALAAKAFANRTAGLGVVIVRVLRPWVETDFKEALPSTVKKIHVLDDVPNAATQGSLYVDVFGSLFDSALSSAAHSHRITPLQTQRYFSHPESFLGFLGGLVPVDLTSLPSLDPPALKKLVLFSTPRSPLSTLSHVVEDIFLSNQGIFARLLTDHDIFSKEGGITANRILLSPKGGIDEHVPIPIILPLAPDSAGVSDFLAVLEPHLLKSHSVIKYAKPGSSVLVVSPSSSAEISSSLPSDVVSLILKRKLRIFVINAKELTQKLVGENRAAHDAIQNLLVHLAFLRLYLATAAEESLVLKVARVALPETIQGVELEKINSSAWSGLSEIQIIVPEPTDPPKSSSHLKEYEFNAIAVETDEGATVVNGAKLSSWHDAAKHLMFPAVYTPTSTQSSEEYPPNPALRPEVPDRTFLITCTVNRRLTPQEYDRNVFHLEFDTSGTGLKYAIGEALGVHGWNDEKEVLEFCSWYGVDPDRLITIPVLGGEDKRMHTRTVLQALQQQIDLFGKPPKSFYTELAAYATNSVQKHALLFIGSAEGSATFKKMSEAETVTFAEVLRRYPSAKPGIETLCGMIGDIKPRHYSIASAQSVVGNRIDLLVVTVEWSTPSGESGVMNRRISIDFFLLSRLSQTRSMYQISFWSPSWSEGHCVYQTIRDEGSFQSRLSRPNTEISTELYLFSLTAPSRQQTTSHHGWTRYRSSTLPCIPSTPCMASPARPRSRPGFLLLRFSSSILRIPLRRRNRSVHSRRNDRTSWTRLLARRSEQDLYPTQDAGGC